MKATGVVRKLDDLGRVVLPVELRRRLGMIEGEPLEIFVDGEQVILKKYQPLCIFCGGGEDLKNYEGKQICLHCRGRIGKFK